MHSFDFLALGQKIILDKGIHNEECTQRDEVLVWFHPWKSLTNIHLSRACKSCQILG